MKEFCRLLLLVLGLTALHSVSAQAQYGGRITCGVYDRGYDENGPDATCGQCLLNHGECVERCSENQYTCRAIGEFLNSGSSRIEVLGRFSSSSSLESAARRQAFNQCESARLRFSGATLCVDLGCRIASLGRVDCAAEAQRRVSVGGGVGSREIFEAIGYSDFDARDQALNRCYRSGARNCSIQNCVNQSRQVSSRICDPRERPNRTDPRPVHPIYPDPIGGLDPYDPNNPYVPQPPRGERPRPRPPQDDGSVRCSADEYLRQRPDVAAALGPNRASACDHYRRHGRGEGMCNPCN